jgi:hypothetical protein
MFAAFDVHISCVWSFEFPSDEFLVEIAKSWLAEWAASVRRCLKFKR